MIRIAQPPSPSTAFGPHFNHLKPFALSCKAKDLVVHLTKLANLQHGRVPSDGLAQNSEVKS